MPGTIKPFRVVQIGKESPSARGTAVAATAKLIGELELTEKPTIHMPSYPRGLLSQHADGGIVAAKDAELAFNSDVTYEQLLYWLLAGVKGAVTASGEGEEKTWTFEPSAVADPAPDSFTLEFRATDGTTPDDFEAEYCLARLLEIRGGMNEPWTMRADIFGRQVADSTLTAAISDPSAWEAALTNLTKVYIDDTWATLGDTQVSGQVVDFTWRLTTGLQPKRYADGQLYFSAYGFGPRLVELDMTLEYAASAIAERAKWRDRSRRFVRVEAEGTVIDTLPKKATLDGCYVYAEDGFAALSERDGNDTVAMKLLSVYDPTAAKDIGVTVVNALATLP